MAENTTPKDTQPQGDAEPKNARRRRGERHVTAAAVADTTPVLPAGRTDVAYPGSARRDDEQDETPRRSGSNVLNSNTSVRNPETGEVEHFTAGSEVPSWATEKRKVVDLDGTEREEALIGDHLFGDQEASLRPSVSTPVPVDRENEVPDRDAPLARWLAYASAYGVIVHGDSSREDIVDALDRAGVPTK